MLFSIIIPVFNEERTILNILRRVNDQKKKNSLEIIVVDDCSTDNTNNILLANQNLYDKLINLNSNYGKGRAIAEGLKHVRGEYMIIQDADLEYNPDDYTKLIQPIIKSNADVVYGSRFIGYQYRRIIYFTHQVANSIITFLVNLMTNLNFTDVETGYKVIRSSIIKDLNLKENSFAIEIEITMKLSKKNIKFYEVGISYSGRTYQDGKKIKFIDAVIAIYKIFYYKLFN